MPVRVLIVDDDTRFRQLIGDVLADRGYEIVGEAGTLADAASRSPSSRRTRCCWTSTCPTATA